ncbi:MAG: hypothetical protein MUP85_01115 [Candidatus Lokiarchaeota archaeon]|nr:hypothetical protein [Candidatus Lokiarchaeota archaeon]
MISQDDTEDIDALREQINELNKELNKKNNDIVHYSEKTHILEDEIIKLRELLPDEPSKKTGKKVKETKLQLELETKDQEMRELKTRMSYLRIENIDIQKELKKIKGSNSPSTVISVEDLREKAPLNVLVKELQEKINKQESLIRRFQHDNSGNDNFQGILKAKDVEIENLKDKIHDLEEINSKSTKHDDDTITKKIMTDLQEKLNKLKKQNEELKSKIDNKQPKSKTDDHRNKNRVRELEDEINTLKSELNKKNSHQEGPLEQVVEELQNKLNKAKSQINILQDHIKGTQAQNIKVSPPADESHIDTTDKLKMQRDLASFLQQQLDDAKRALKTKVEEIGTIKNEAIRIKRRYEDLENQVQFKDNSIRELRNDYDTLKLQTQLHSANKQEENPSYELRLQELKSMVEDLTKVNIQQRLEINQLRKNT